ncbi:hypothetical protein DMN91_007969 [Ooceraea biroi]|uniref:Uncharacterized protein n=1 Tax=Ooceraea biroi TaxID=2015173 RepID=A0A3L8DGV9_OOCBI|nr:hypothetical protein DMN91_007969 [Ooceraea biroi]
MSANKEAIKLPGRNKSVDLTRKKQLPMIIAPVASETRVQSRFDSHTLSSLMKRKELIYLKKLSSTSTSSSMRCTRDAQKKAEASVVSSGLSGICKKRNSVTKQSKSMQTVKMIFQREKDRRASDTQDNALAKTVCQPKQLVDLFSSILFQNDLIINVSRSLKKCAVSQTKNVVPHDERTNTIVHQPEKRAENSRVPSQDEIKLEENSLVQSSSESTWDCSENHSVVDVTPKIQSNEEEAAKMDSNCEIQVVHCELSSGEPTEKSEEDLLYVDRAEIETRVYRRSRRSTNANVATANPRKSTRKTWMIKKANTQREHVDGDHAYRADPRAATNSTSFRRKADNSRENTKSLDDQMTQTKNSLQKNFVPLYQRVWRPPGINRASSTVKNTFSTQSTSQKSSRSAGKFVSTRNKQTSNECIEETKQQQKWQSGTLLPKRRRSANKMVSQASNKSNDVEPSRSNSRSRYWQTRAIAPALKNRNDTDQCRTEATLTYNKRAKPSEVIHALKEIINCVNGDENAVSVSNNDAFHHENGEREILNDTFSKLTPNDERPYFTSDNNLDRIAQSVDFSLESSWKSITTQTESNFPLSSELGDGKRFDENSKKTVKSFQTVATQVSLRYEKNVVEIGCNTVSCDIIRRDAEISCALIGSANVATNGDPTVTEDKLTSENIEVVDDKSFDENLCTEEAEDTGEVLNTEISPKSRAHVSVEEENNFIKKTEEIVRKEDTDKQEFKGCIDKYDADYDTVELSFGTITVPKYYPPSLFYDFDASSSEEIAESIENDAKYEEETARSPNSKMSHIPSDVIAAFELAAERARNLYKAIMIYQENLMSRECERQNEETTENYKTLYRPTVDEDRVKKCALFQSEAEDEMKSEYETKCHFVMVNDDFDGLSTCSSSNQTCSSTSDQMYKLGCISDLMYQADHSEIESLRKDNVIFSQSDTAITKSILNEGFDVANVKSLILVPRVQEHALAMVKFNDNRDGENFKLEESASILAFPMIERPSFISRENLFPFICCVLCTMIFWSLQSSFRCNPSA